MKNTLHATVLAILTCVPLQGQQMGAFGRERAQEMLHNIMQDVKKHYYDPTFHGIDVDAVTLEADEKLKHATSVNESYRIIADALGHLNDNHTHFYPPRNLLVNYGWRMQRIGQRFYVTQVHPESNAKKMGLKAGDEVLSINNVTVTAENLDTLRYLIYALSPQPELRLQVRSPGEQPRWIVAAAKVEPNRVLNGNISAAIKDDHVKYAKLRKSNFPHCRELGADVGVCKIGSFDFDDQQLREVQKFAHTRQALVVDLRGNMGGPQKVLGELCGSLFDHDIEMFNRISRAGSVTELAKPNSDPFAGKLIVLIDSQTASDAEIFARTVQREKRGILMGDRSKGSVRDERFFDHRFKLEENGFYFAVVSDADRILPGGESLEGKGVVPDNPVVPSPLDLATGRDPVLALAATLLGAKLTPEDAGKLFPFEWPDLYW